MRQALRRVLDDNYYVFVENMDSCATFPRLVAKDVLTTRKAKEVRTLVGVVHCCVMPHLQLKNRFVNLSTEAIAEQFIDHIKTCPDAALAYLYEALVLTKQSHLAKILQPHLQDAVPGYVAPTEVRVRSLRCKGTRLKMSGIC